ncbi:MAG: hypothetical protein Q9217_000020 [Psora testacea]
MIEPDQLTLPASNVLRLPDVQDQIYEQMFDDGRAEWMPPVRYRFRVLKRLLNAMEQAIEDPEEDEISDKLSNLLAQYMVDPLPPAIVAAQQKVYVTYSAPNPDIWAPQVTLLEAPYLLASSGTTGFRTWEAALHLGAFLFSDNGKRYVAGKRVLELGAGTGFLSIFCAKHLGVQHVLATDGSLDVVNDIKVNARHNLPDSHEIYEIAMLRWGHALIGGVADCRNRDRAYDIVLGADVTYDVKSIPALMATIRDLFELYPESKVLISATVRNQNTLSAFITACKTNNLYIERLDFPVPSAEDQIGFFIPTLTSIEIFVITHTKDSKDAFTL